VKVLGAAFVMLMKMRSSSARRPRCAERCSAREYAKLTFAFPTVAKANRDKGRPRCDCGSKPSRGLTDR
jgi:hypothetical protein